MLTFRSLGCRSKVCRSKVWLPAAGVCLGVTALAGCGSATGAAEGSAGTAAAAFIAAVDASDAIQACALLAPKAVESLESLRPEGCQQALPSLELPHDPVAKVSVWGDAAQVHTASDVLFLRELSDGWRVVAAGCRSQGEDRPYECELTGS